jgi:predicted ATPase
VTPLIERERTLAPLDACLGEVQHGSGRIALVSGEAGIGKTSVVDAFLRRHRGNIRSF